MKKDNRTLSQVLADRVTEFSGSWPFILLFGWFCMMWIILNVNPHLSAFDPYPFLFLNWLLTIVSTFQSPLIMMSQNRQNEVDQERVSEMLSRLDRLQDAIDRLEKK